jgi:hypothetical protein
VAKLDLHILKRNDKTFTKFDKNRDNDKIVFHNLDTTDQLAVTIESQPGLGDALCKGNQPVNSFVVAAGNKEPFKLCSTYTGDSFKYTAQIGTSTAEDPIIIISRSSVPPELVIAVVVVVALALAVYIGMRLERSRATRPT